MIRRSLRRAKPEEPVESKGFDAFELRLGDLMRGERATMGKSLLDVQRELKIKAAYIAAIENCDPTAFDTPGFIAGYVRSYARYLRMDPDKSFAAFCAESGFRPAHGMSAEASPVRPSRPAVGDTTGGRDIFSSSATPFIPANDSLFSGIEPRAIGSVLVLVAVIGGLGWGAWSVLQEVQRVQFAPVDQAPTVVADVDPLSGAGQLVAETVDTEVAAFAPTPEALDRLYRPQALDVPVLVARDAPIATLAPDQSGALVAAGVATQRPAIDTAPDAVDGAVAVALADTGADPAPGVRVTAGPAPEMVLVAVRPAWVRVRSAEGTTLYEKIMDAGETWEIPATENPATLRTGESGAVYFAVNGVHYGPAGARGTITSDLALSVDNLTETYAVADLTRDQDLAEMVRFAEVQVPQTVPSE